LKPRIRDHVTFTKTEDEAVLLDEKSGRYWQLNSSATLALSALLDGGREAAVRALTKRFAVDEARAESDITAMLRQLTSAGLVIE
jgi:coenzyme PQQ synthesis protein D (PqqD)